MANYSTNEFRPGLKVMLDGDPCSRLVAAGLAASLAVARQSPSQVPTACCGGARARCAAVLER